MLEMVHLDFIQDDMTWFASKLSGAAGVLGAEAVELRNWLLCLGCSSDELRVPILIYLLFKITLRAQHSRSKGKLPKRYPSTARRMM